MVAVSVAVAVGGLFVLAATGFTWAAQDPRVAHIGAWSPAQLRAVDPVPRVEAGLCLVLFVAAAFSVVRLAIHRIRALSALRRSIRDCRPSHHLLVVPDERAEAFTTAGPRGTIVVTTGL